MCVRPLSYPVTQPSINQTHLIGVGHLELPAVPRPGDKVLTGLVGEQLQDELPQLDGTGGGDGGSAHPRGRVAQAARQWRYRRR